VVLAKDTVAYAAGNLVVILNPETQEQSAFRSLGGGGIGAIAVSDERVRGEGKKRARGKER
jgi:hypothetical protein